MLIQLKHAHDKSIAIAQELQEQIDRSIKLSRTNTMTSTEFTVDATNRANKILAFDSAMRLLLLRNLEHLLETGLHLLLIMLEILVKDTSTNNIFICTQLILHLVHNH